jgi:hypothetical protein
LGDRHTKRREAENDQEDKVSLGQDGPFCG